MLSKKKSTCEEVQLRNFFQIKHGFAFKSKYFEEEGDFLVLTPGNFNEDGGLKFRESKEKYYSGNFKDEYLLKKGDLLVVMTDLKQDAPILGSPAFIPESGKYLHNQRLGKIIDLQDDLDIVFLYYFFNSTLFREQIKSTATGATVKHTSPDRILDVKVKIPSLDIQKKIGQTLRSFDDLVEVNLRRIEVLEEVARCLYEEWFIHLRYPGHENTETTQTPHGTIPKEWNYEPIGQVVDTLGGGTPSTKESSFWEDGNNNWYTPSDITSNNSIFITQSSRKITEKGLKSSSSKRFPAYSLMMTSRATLGELAINTTEASTNQGFITMIPTEQLPVYYLYFWVKQNLELIMNLASGATFKEINKTTFRKIPILVPGQSIIDQFNEIMKPIGALLENLIRKNRVLKETRDLLLPKLISGEIDVSDIDIQL